MNGRIQEFQDFSSWWSNLNEYFQKIYINVKYLYEQNHDSIIRLTRKEYMEIYK